MSEHRFSDKEIETMLDELGFINLKHVASTSQLNKLIELAIKNIIGEPVAIVSQNYTYQNYTAIKTDALDITQLKVANLKTGDKLYLIKK
jgi:hypothetical protein